MSKGKCGLIAIVFPLLFLTACSIAVPKVPICSELSPSTGYCINTITSEEYMVSDTQLHDGQTWFDMKASMMMVPASSWVELKAFIIKICRKSGKCDTKLGNWERTIEKIDHQVIGTDIGVALE